MLPTRAERVRQVGRCGSGAQPVGQFAANGLQPLVRRIVPQQSQRGDAGCGGHRVAAERARLKHFAGGQHVIHDVGPATVGTQSASRRRRSCPASSGRA